MVFYECVLTAKNTAHFAALTSLLKDVSHQIVTTGGIVRTIQNHGIRQLPHRFKAKYPDKMGNRYYDKGRFVSIYYDANPRTMREVEGILDLNEEVLRNTHLKARNTLWYVNVAREDRNPYIQKVLEMERAEQEKAAAAAEEGDAAGDGEAEVGEMSTTAEEGGDDAGNKS